MNPLPATIDSLVNLANETGHTYADAYSIWQKYHQQEEVYLIIDTVLWIAKRQQIPVLAALALYQGIEDQFGQL